MPGALLDTGPLVAFLNRRDRFHAWATARLGEVAAPLSTCEAVISESCFLLRHVHGGADAVLALLDRGLLVIAFDLGVEKRRVRRLLKRYADVPMSLADACLVRMSELVSDRVVLTLDTHFRLYRRHGRQVVPTVMPDP